MIHKAVSFFLGVFLFGGSFLGFSEEGKLSLELKMRQPNWRVEVVKKFPNGSPEKVIFYEPTEGENETPVKQILFYEEGQIREEADLAVVEKDSPGFIAWNSSTAPSGACVNFFFDGKVERVSFYNKGLLEGEVRSFYPSGKLYSSVTYRRGILEGKTALFYEEGGKKEEGFYREGKKEGDCWAYYPEGKRHLLFPYEKGELNGIVMEWHPEGELKSERRFVHGKLQGDGKNPALVVYDERHSLIEALDFDKGNPVAFHLRYHSNGKEAYRVLYKEGKKEGKEQFFSSEGKLIGEGAFSRGKATGKHWKNFEDGSPSWSAEFDESGNLLHPAEEYFQGGKLAKRFFEKEGKLEGAYQEWYPNGKIRVDFHYEKGVQQGEQKEYYSSGTMKLLCSYQNKEKEGLFQEWHENGVLARKAAFKAGKLEGKAEEWNDKGELLFEGHYEQGLPSGEIRSWYGKNKPREVFHFVKGKKEGKQEWFFPNGKPQKKAFFQNDLLEGDVVSWYENGDLFFQGKYRGGIPVGEHRKFYEKKKEGPHYAQLFCYDDKGEMEGAQKTFYPDGTQETVINYTHGILHGLKARWDSSGNLIEESSYDKGKVEGRFFQKMQEGKEIIFTYHHNRKEGPHWISIPVKDSKDKVKILEANYKKDKLEGPFIEYDDKGAKKAESFYIDGKKEGKTIFYGENSKPLIVVECKNDLQDGLTIQYFPNGKVYKEVPFIKGKKEGEEKTYFPSGKVAAIFLYKEGQLHGKSIHWNEKGTILFEGEYQKGLRHGKFNKYYDNGSPYLEQNFKNDQLHGIKKKYDKNGEVISSYEDGKAVKSSAKASKG